MDTRLNAQISKVWSQRLNVQPEAPWQNAVNGLLTAGGNTSRYVEGWAITYRGLVVEHAWIEVENEIVDPTFYNQPIYRYIAGPSWTGEELQNAFRDKAVPLPVVYHLRNPKYSALYQAAFAAAMTIQVPKNKPENKPVGLSTHADKQASPVKVEIPAGSKKQTVSKVQYLCDRAARRVVVEFPYVDTLRVTANWAGEVHRLHIETVIGIAGGLQQTFPIILTPNQLATTDEELYEFLFTTLESCIERYLAVR